MRPPTTPGQVLQTVSSWRDLRDPQILGAKLLDKKKRGLTASQIYDKYIHNLYIPYYNANPSCLEKYPPHEGAGTTHSDPLPS